MNDDYYHCRLPVRNSDCCDFGGRVEDPRRRHRWGWALRVALAGWYSDLDFDPLT